VRLIAFNDFHGYIDPPGIISLSLPDDASKSVSEPVGGAAYLATMVRQMKKEHPLNVVVAAGDLVGASPLNSALFHDEAAIQVLSQMGLEFSSVGNHEFDHGTAELLRKQRGGCFPEGHSGEDTCLLEGRFAGATFTYLAANVIDLASGRTLFPPYAIKQFELADGRRLKIAFIGLVLKQTPSLVPSSGISSLRFTDEADAANALVPQLHAQGVNAIIVLIHQGVRTSVGFNDPNCTGVSGELLPILDRLDPSIALVVSGHTHAAYRCQGSGTKRPWVHYTSAGKYGEFLTTIDLSLNAKSGKISDISAENHVVVNDTVSNPAEATYPTLAPDPDVAALVSRYDAVSGGLINRVVGRITADITGTGQSLAGGGSGETSLGDLVADAHLDAAQADPNPPVIALTNPGGLRADLLFGQLSGGERPGEVTYGEVYNVQPFGDVLTDLDLSGAQLYAALAQQWEGQTSPKILQVSRGLSYAWDGQRPDGTSKLIEGSLALNGIPVDRDKIYRVEVNNFLAEGGDGFAAFLQGTNRYAVGKDVDALTQYVATHSPLTPSAVNRIARVH